MKQFLTDVCVYMYSINSETTLSNKTESAEESTQAVYVVVLLFAK